jgi:hypothetical protein
MINKIQEQHKKSCEEGFSFYSSPTPEYLSKEADFIKEESLHFFQVIYFAKAYTHGLSMGII